jgi:hypothetical protein
MVVWSSVMSNFGGGIGMKELTVISRGADRLLGNKHVGKQPDRLSTTAALLDPDYNIHLGLNPTIAYEGVMHLPRSSNYYEPSKHFI